MAAPYQRSTAYDGRAAWESPALIISVLLLGAVGLIWYIASERFHLRQAQIAELSFYVLLFLSVIVISLLLPLTSRQRREREWPHPPFLIPPAHLERQMKRASEQDAIILGYDIHGTPWLWPDRIL